MINLVDLKKLIFLIAALFCLLIILQYSKYISEYQSSYMYGNIRILSKLAGATEFRWLPWQQIEVHANLLKIPETRYIRNYERNGDLQRRPIPIRNTTKLRVGPVYVLGVVARNTTNRTAWDVVNVYGSLKKDFIKMFANATCCVMYDNQRDRSITNIVRQNALQIKFHPVKSHVTSFHIVCPNIYHSVGVAPVAVGLSRTDIGCDGNKDKYVKVVFPHKEPGFKIVIGTQIAYKDISAELIIEWMETYKTLQVDKVVSYYHRSVNQDALKVLTYYHNTGFVDLYETVLPEEDAFPRKFKHASAQLYNDLRVSVYDMYERMSGFTYFGIIDFDEFLIPAGNKTIKEMLMELQNTYQGAAGFVFKTQFFFLTWGKSNNDSDLILGQFVNRTSALPKVDRPKQLWMPANVRQGGIRTHVFVPDKNFTRIHVPAKIGFLRHFRSCRKTKSTDCVEPSERVIDKTVVEWSKLIENNVRLARKKIFGMLPH